MTSKKFLSPAWLHRAAVEDRTAKPKFTKDKVKAVLLVAVMKPIEINSVKFYGHL